MGQVHKKKEKPTWNNNIYQSNTYYSIGLQVNFILVREMSHIVQ